MSSIHLEIPGPSCTCGIAILVPLLSALAGFAWRRLRSARQREIDG